MSGVTSIDSMSLGEILLAKFRWDRQARTAATIVPSAGILRTLTILHVLERLNVARNHNEALERLAQPTPVRNSGMLPTRLIEV
jgi:hypothetical protein